MLTIIFATCGVLFFLSLYGFYGFWWAKQRDRGQLVRCSGLLETKQVVQRSINERRPGSVDVVYRYEWDGNAYRGYAVGVRNYFPAMLGGYSTPPRHIPRVGSDLLVYVLPANPRYSVLHPTQLRLSTLLIFSVVAMLSIVPLLVFGDNGHRAWFLTGAPIAVITAVLDAIFRKRFEGRLIAE